MVAVLPRFFYDIKYVGGTEQRIDACFVEKIELVSSFSNVLAMQSYSALVKPPSADRVLKSGRVHCTEEFACVVGSSIRNSCHLDHELSVGDVAPYSIAAPSDIY